MTNKEKSSFIIEQLNKLLPNARIELSYTTDYGLLIAVMLSAQATDVSVNNVTPKLFATFPRLEDIVNADIADIEVIIKSIGLYKTKAKNVHATARLLLDKFAGRVPEDKEALVSLPGVGVKTANVVRAELFKIPEFAVDTHVARVSKRLAIAKDSDNVETIEKKLRKFFPAEAYIALHHQIIHFGRYICKAQRPQCKGCPFLTICVEKKKNLEV